MNKAMFLPMEVKFDLEKATAILMIDKAHLDLETKKSIAEQYNLSEKDDFHLTIIGSDTGEEILKSLEPLGEIRKNKILNKIRRLCESYNWQMRSEQKFYYLKKEYGESNNTDLPSQMNPEIRQSIIQIARVDKLDGFYQELNTLLGKHFKTPLPHITLYTTSTKEDKKLRGIGVYSKDQLEELKPEKI